MVRGTYPLAVLGLLGVALSASAAPKPPVQPRLPDLKAVAETMQDYHVSEEDGKRLLRFSSAVANVGDGPLEVNGRRKGKRMRAYQKIYRTRGKPQQRVIGEFIHHPEHHHWHLLQVAEYRLLDLQGGVIRTSDKISFCLLDTEPVFPPVLGGSPFRRYLTCSQDPRAHHLSSGVSVGWSDIYGSELPDQWVDITGLPGGTYQLQVILNPDNTITEKTLDNNTATIQVTIP